MRRYSPNAYSEIAIGVICIKVKVPVWLNAPEPIEVKAVDSMMTSPSLVHPEKAPLPMVSHKGNVPNVVRLLQPEKAFAPKVWQLLKLIVSSLLQPLNALSATPAKCSKPFTVFKFEQYEKAPSPKV
nr:hypothetical protein [Xylanibacter ruminicola]